jgi:hypothetical protein
MDQHGKVDAPKLCLAIAEQNAQLRIAQLDGLQIKSVIVVPLLAYGAVASGPCQK